jgi:hypothetical protein
MGVIESLFGAIARWFGFVGACVAGPDATCVPFAAFLALAIAAAAGLWLIVRAYSRLQADEASHAQARRKRLERERAEERIRRTVATRVEPRQTAHRGWRMPA